jgi:hypothetical protein
VDANDIIVVENVDVTRDHAPAGTHFMGAKMPYYMRFSGGSGLHSGYLPGFPDSHGCVRLPDDMASRERHVRDYLDYLRQDLFG